MSQIDDSTYNKCPIHGQARKRQTCSLCNAAYMRGYLRRRRASRPELALLERARTRARRAGLPYSLQRSDISIPPTCPALGIPLTTAGPRSDSSPSLDRIRPQEGYVCGNVRVLSDRANRMKGKRTIAEIQQLAISAPGHLRADYLRIGRYMQREALLAEVRIRAAGDGRHAQEWGKIAKFLDRVFRNGGSA